MGNVGKSGHTSDHHVLQVRHLLAQYPHIDVVTVLVGVNDMLRLAHEGEYRPMTSEQLALTFWTSPGWEERDAVYKGTRSGDWCAEARQQSDVTFPARSSKTRAARCTWRLRANRRAARVSRHFPDLDTD